MSKSSARPAIRLRGVRHNNLKNLDLDLPLNQLIVITGVSGSGKSSLAFDTLFAEGQRRYIETFSPYARQFLDRMDKPQVDSIEGIPPAIAVEQRNSVRTTRSTVGTMTEICDYMKTLWSHIALLHCRQCGEPVRKDSPQNVWHAISSLSSIPEWLITFELPLSGKLSLAESLALISKQGYQRLLINGAPARLDEASTTGQHAPAVTDSLTVIQDRLKTTSANRARFVEACEQAYHFGKGRLTVWELSDALALAPRPFSCKLHCARCNLEYGDATPALFSFNHPLGACPTCRGFGRIISIDYNLALPDRTRTLSQGVVKPWLTGQSAECQADLLRMCRKQGIPMDVPFEDLSPKWQDLVIDGDPDYGKDEAHEWPTAWYGVKGYFRWLESKAYKMHVRVLLSRYRAYTPCPVCAGKRFQPEALLYRAPLNEAAQDVDRALTLADFYQLPIRAALALVEQWSHVRRFAPREPLGLALMEVRARLQYLNDVGLGYMTLDRPTRSLSGGETERVNLTTCLGTRLVNTLFVLDEPSVGLHPRDTQRLVRILEQLRSAGNTVVVVEHEASVMRAADRIIDLGPGHGAQGGQVVFQGTYPQILRATGSLTGQYLSGRKEILPAEPRWVPGLAGSGRERSNARQADGERIELARPALNEARVPYGTKHTPAHFLRVTRASRHNLKNLTVEIPLNRFVCVTGVSGSGKTTLVREVLLPSLQVSLRSQASTLKASDRIPAIEDPNEANQDIAESGGLAHLSGCECLSGTVLVDQTILAKTPRSNPAVYIGAFDHIREFFAQNEAARQRGLGPSAFSFNSAQGQCQRCRGAGFEKIEMQFLSDVFIRCPECNGRRYRSHILAIRIAAPATPTPGGLHAARPTRRHSQSFSIADLLEATAEEATCFLAQFPNSRPALRAVQSLRWLEQVGLGYLQLGQPVNTLSGGESQRLKLVRHLADIAELGATTSAVKPILFLFDEPTTGLHFDDVRVLLKVFQRLVNEGHSVLVIEHNLDLIKCADWLIDLGPDAGDQGGELVVAGTPAQVAACDRSHTGCALRELAGVRPQRAAA